MFAKYMRGISKYRRERKMALAVGCALSLHTHTVENHNLNMNDSDKNDQKNIATICLQYEWAHLENEGTISSGGNLLGIANRR